VVVCAADVVCDILEEIGVLTGMLVAEGPHPNGPKSHGQLVPQLPVGQSMLTLAPSRAVIGTAPWVFNSDRPVGREGEVSEYVPIRFKMGQNWNSKGTGIQRWVNLEMAKT
jgi:hypothetical protein